MPSLKATYKKDIQVTREALMRGDMLRFAANNFAKELERSGHKVEKVWSRECPSSFGDQIGKFTLYADVA